MLVPGRCAIVVGALPIVITRSHLEVNVRPASGYASTRVAITKLGNHTPTAKIFAGWFRHNAARQLDMTRIQKRIYTGWNGGLDVGWNVVMSLFTIF